MKYVIGYYENPMGSYRVYVQDSYSYVYVEDIRCKSRSEMDKIVEEMKKKYPSHNVCQFKY